MPQTSRFAAIRPNLGTFQPDTWQHTSRVCWPVVGWIPGGMGVVAANLPVCGNKRLEVRSLKHSQTPPDVSHRVRETAIRCPA